MHEDPRFLITEDQAEDQSLPGMALAIEPMVNQGDASRVLLDNWTVVTLDGKLSAHYENTVVITDGDRVANAIMLYPVKALMHE